MKTEEDEAFDDLARRQGMWGGGFPAKRQMAADKQEPWNEDEWRRNNWRCGHGWLRGEQCEICNAPKQHMAADKLWDKPTVAFDEWWNGDNDESTNPFRLESGAYWAWAGWKAALAQPAHCQCPACKDGVLHASDCAVHTGPAYSLGPCDCGVEKGQEEDWGALAEKQLASIKRDTQASFEDAMARATHKVMAELEAQPAYPAGPCDRGVMNDRQRLEAIVSVINKYLPPFGMHIMDAMSAIISLVDPLPPATQPAQEPEMLTIAYQSGYYDGKKAALAGREWNFCERCGKRTADIHTCTPPQGDA